MRYKAERIEGREEGRKLEEVKRRKGGREEVRKGQKEGTAEGRNH